MKRVALTLLAVIVLGLGAYYAALRWCTPSNPSSWVCQEFGVSHQVIDPLVKDHDNRCGPLCGKMCAANAKLQSLALGSQAMTPEIRAALEETDQVRTEARTAMLEHFYAVSAQLPSEKRRAYLLKVLPLIVDSCGGR